MACPKCGSDQWQSASLIHSAGLTATSATSIAVGGHGGVDPSSASPDLLAGAVQSQGTAQTMLSKLAAPPSVGESKADGINFILGVITLSAFLLGWSLGNILAGFLFALLACMVAVPIGFLLYPARKRKAEKEELERNHRAAIAEFERKVMCLRCGAFYQQEELLCSVASATVHPNVSRGDA